MKNLVSLLLVLSLGAFLSVSAQTSEPTLQETLDFIAGKVTNKLGCGLTYKSRTGNTLMGKDDFEQYLTFDGVKGTLRHRYLSTFKSGTVSKDELSDGTNEFDLKDLIAPEIKQAEDTDKVIIQPKCYSLILRTYNGRKVIKSKHNKHGENMYDSVTFFFWEHEKELVERVAKALTHAITLAGGRKESF